MVKIRVWITATIEAESDDDNDVIPIVQDLFALGVGNYSIDNWEKVR